MIAALIILFLLKLRFPRGTQLSTVITRRYGRQGLQLFRRLEKTSIKLKKNESDLKFLKTCKSYEVIPKFLYFKLYKRNLLNSKLYRKWQFKLLNIEINHKTRTIKNLEKERNKLDSELQSRVSFLDYYYFKSYIYKNVYRSCTRISETHQKKLKSLGITNSLDSLDPSKVIFNYSNRKLTPKEEGLLAYGLNFKLPNFHINFYKHFLSFENLYSYLDKEIPHGDHSYSFKQSLKNLAYKSFYNFKPYKVFSPIFSKNDIAILKTLSKDTSIIISKPDKGHGVVILDKIDYVRKMEDLLNDRKKFRELLTEDPLLYTLNMENKINYRIRKLKSDGIISEELASSLMASGTQPGIMYGSPKIHKRGIPLRPILSAINTCSYGLSKYLVNKLSPLTVNEYTLKNTYEFVELITSINNANNYVMCSFDIESLFTNIPLHETLDIILKLLFPNPDDIFEGFNKKQFKILLELATTTSTFFFNNKLYEQVDGVAMGSPCGPTLANIFLCFCERKWLSDCPAEFKPFLYRRYVDDTFLLFNNANQANQFLEYLNSKHPNIKFTKEGEQDNALPFLDVLVTRKHNTFESSVYRKMTFTGLSTHFLSSEPRIYKINAIKTLLYRCYHVCSTYLTFHKEVTFLNSFFTSNGFPSKLYYNQLRQFLNKIYSPKPSIQTASKKKLYVSFPFYGYVSERLRTEIMNIVSKYYSHIDLRLIFTNKFSIGSLFKYKESLPTPLCSGVIYTYHCALCNECYTGSTTRQLQCRIAEHMGKSVRTNTPLSKSPVSAIYDHSFKSGHAVSKDNFKIIDRHSNKSQLRLLESLYIFKTKPTLNDGLPVQLPVTH